jgi:argininosuccinate synthase
LQLVASREMKRGRLAMFYRELNQVDATSDYDGIALYSGGTDSTLAALLSRQFVGDHILLVMVDLGETSSSIEQARCRAELIGWDFLLVDGQEGFAREILAESIMMRASYWGYPLGTPLGRAYQLTTARALVDRLNSYRHRRRYIVHGCTALQNTRYRIERFLATVPDVEPFGPFVGCPLSRSEKVGLLAEYGISVVPGDGVATDQNIYCRAMEGDLLNTLDSPASLPVYTIVQDPDKAATCHLSLTFESGLPIAVDGRKESLAAIVRECASRGARSGIGRICVFEDTIPELGYKERGIYEAPAAVLLATAHAYLEGAALTKLDRTIFRGLRQAWAEVVYRGDWHTSERQALGGEGRRLNRPITGNVILNLYRGLVEVGDAECENSLLINPNASHGAY